MNINTFAMKNKKLQVLAHKGSFARNCFICLLGVTLLWNCGANQETLTGNQPDWSDYTAILGANVQAGQKDGISLAIVNYKQIAADRRWPGVVESIQKFPLERLQTPEEKLAFYTNAYNIATINLIIEHDFPSSINKLGKSVWDRPAIELGGQKMSLNHIEHKILRPLGDARVHFAIVCASVSCPDLRGEAYTANRIDAQFNEQADVFVDNTGKGVRIDQAKGVVHASKLFEWFAEDFKSYYGPMGFIRKYHKNLPEGLRLQTDIEYNWNLNG